MVGRCITRRASVWVAAQAGTAVSINVGLLARTRFGQVCPHIYSSNYIENVWVLAYCSDT